MGLDAIKALPVADMAAKDAVLFMWAIDSMLPEALGVIEAWGFTFKTVGFTWAKENIKSAGFFTGMGYWTRCNPEQCLLATRGIEASSGVRCANLTSRDVLLPSRNVTERHRSRSDERLERFGRGIDEGKDGAETHRKSLARLHPERKRLVQLGHVLSVRPTAGRRRNRRPRAR